MQIDSVETKAGVAICDALSRTISSMSFSGFRLPIAVYVFNFNGRVVHQDADGQGKSTERHNIDRFSDRAQHNDGG